MLNNEKNGTKDKQYCNLLKTENNEKGIKSDDIDVELAQEEDNGTDKCTSTSWTSLYTNFITWKWFSVSNHLIILKKLEYWVPFQFLKLIQIVFFPKGVAVTLYISWIVVSGLGVTKLRLGLPITDVVPSHSAEWEFLTAQGKLFPVSMV